MRVRDADGAEGVGYTYTVGAGGAAIHALVARDLGAAARRARRRAHRGAVAARCGGRSTTAAAAALRRSRSRPSTSRSGTCRRAGAARRSGALLGGFDPRVPCYAGGIDLQFPLDALLRQTDDNLAQGFRAIKMKVGRAALAEDVERVRAMREHLGAGLPADGRRQHALERR